MASDIGGGISLLHTHLGFRNSRLCLTDGKLMVGRVDDHQRHPRLHHPAFNKLRRNFHHATRHLGNNVNLGSRPDLTLGHHLERDVRAHHRLHKHAERSRRLVLFFRFRFQGMQEGVGQEAKGNDANGYQLFDDSTL